MGYGFEMVGVKKFFGITEQFRIEIADVSALLTLVNVVLIICGVWFAPIFGLVNCGLSIVMSILTHGHVNGYIINLALIALNVYFLM